MKTKQSFRWVIVLLLLAALPGMTAVLAQEQEPAQSAPVAGRPGPLAVAIPWVNNEHEPANNSRATADPGMGVRGGLIGQAGDVDYYRINIDAEGTTSGWVERTHYPLLINVRAQWLNVHTPLNTIVCLYSDDNIELACNDNTDTIDSKLYYNVEANRDYYYTIRDRHNDGGSLFKYQVLVSTPWLISAAAEGLGVGAVEDVAFQAGDILAFSRFSVGGATYNIWVLLFDLSDLGLKGNVVNIASGWRNSDYLLMSFAANIRLPGIDQTVTPWDVVVFDPTIIGGYTQGVFQGWWAGRQHGLMTKAEKIDAIEWPSWNGGTRLYLSTAGTAAVPNAAGRTFKFADEDVAEWRIGPPENWIKLLDTSVVAGLAGEDMVALSFTQYNGGYSDYVDEDYFVVFQGTAQCYPGNNPSPVFSQKDIVIVTRTTDTDWEGHNPYCSLAWHGPDYGWNYNIDAIQAQYHMDGRW